MFINQFAGTCVRPPHFFDAAMQRADRDVETRVAADAAPEQQQPVSRAGGFATGIADVIRGVGAGYLQAGKSMAIAAEKGYIYPLEGAYTAANALASATSNVKYVGKATGYLKIGIALAGTMHSAQISGMLKAPGQTVDDAARSIADKIDGKSTFDGRWGLGLGISPADQVGSERGSIGSALIALGARA